nr:VWA domain-containing protein [Candidatus Sigynarchaeota archaeon]
MSSEVVEDTVVILDISRSMARTDISPNRFIACKQALIHFAKKKLAASTQHKIGTVVFGERAQKMLFFTNEFLQVEESIANANISGNVSYIGAAIALGIQMHVDMLRQISGKVSRMLLLSDGRFSRNTAMDPLQMAKLAHGLGIQIDVVAIGPEDPSGMLKAVANQTNGEYKNVTDGKDLIPSVEGFIKILPESTREYLKSKKPLLSDLAGELVAEADMTPAQLALIEKMTESERHKCMICFKSDCMICKQPFSVCGRHCPNCGYPMHLDCAAQWALSDKKAGSSNVFRCSHCFYLLKVPAAQIQKSEDAQNTPRVSAPQFPLQEKKQDVVENRQGIDLATRVTPQEIGVDMLATATCPVCDELFEDEEYMLECPNLDCSALYHPKCFDKLKDSSGNLVCKRCNQALRKVD